MGSGKSSAAIEYMNSHPDKKFIYVTPYIDEAGRIAKACPALNFVEPSDSDAIYHYRKSEHIAALIANGSNVATTHQSFARFSEESLLNVRSNKYTLIIDEAVDMIQSIKLSVRDIEDAVRLGYITKTGDAYKISNASYDGRCYRNLIDIFDHGEVLRYNATTGEIYFWVLPAELITAFESVFILTYLFEGQALSQYLKLHNVAYSRIGVSKNAAGKYTFCNNVDSTPSWITNISDYITVIDRPKLNEVGDNRNALSWKWFRTHSASSPQMERLRKNLTNFFYNICSDSTASTRLCGSCKDGIEKLSGKGYAKAMIAFNTRATNQYSQCKYLAYVMNVFFNPNTARYFTEHNLKIDEDTYALSVMLQWIWRSAIRNGEPITLYVPSRRMRGLLQDWIATVSA